MPLIRKWS